MSDYLLDLLKSAEVALDRGDLDSCESIVSSVLRKAAKQTRNNDDERRVRRRWLFASSLNRFNL